MRAPSRDALVSNCCTITARPISTIPVTIVRKMGTSSANSAIAAPRRRPSLAPERERRRVIGDSRERRPVMVFVPAWLSNSQSLLYKEDGRVNVVTGLRRRRRIWHATAGVDSRGLHRQVLAAHRTRQIDVEDPHSDEGHD